MNSHSPPDTLKPCPFCGDRAYVFNPWSEVSCLTCSAAVGGIDKEDAINHWNRRYQPKPLTAPTS